MQPSGLETSAGSSPFANSVTDSDIMRRNWALINRGVDVVANKVWELGKEVGVTNIGSEGDILGHLEGMEKRDRIAAGRVVCDEGEVGEGRGR